MSLKKDKVTASFSRYSDQAMGLTAEESRFHTPQEQKIFLSSKVSTHRLWGLSSLIVKR
jgi:hypothetical protein